MKIGRNVTHVALCITTVLFASACATTGGSVGTGAAAGGLLGAGVGAIADPGKNGENRLRNVIIGTAAGGVLGAGTGFALGQHMRNEREGAFTKGKEAGAKENGSAQTFATGAAPQLIPPRTEARWIPDQVRGGTFVPGHFEYVITEGARWSAGGK